MKMREKDGQAEPDQVSRRPEQQRGCFECEIVQAVVPIQGIDDRQPNKAMQGNCP